MSQVKSIDTTTFQNKKWRTYIPESREKLMDTTKEEQPKASKYAQPTGYDVFWWPEFQALAERLMIDLEAPITEIQINLHMDGLVKVQTSTNGLDRTEEK